MRNQYCLMANIPIHTRSQKHFYKAVFFPYKTPAIRYPHQSINLWRTLLHSPGISPTFSQKVLNSSVSFYYLLFCYITLGKTGLFPRTFSCFIIFLYNILTIFIQGCAARKTEKRIFYSLWPNKGSRQFSPCVRFKRIRSLRYQGSSPPEISRLAPGRFSSSLPSWRFLLANFFIL